MKKKNNKFAMVVLMIIFMGTFFAGNVFAKGSASVSWIKPTTNEDASALTDLAGYRIFYSTAALGCTAWDAATSQATRLATPLASVAHVDVTEANTIRDSAVANKRGYTFNTGNLLTVGQTYNFTVVAYDTSGNYSKCVNDAGANKTQSKVIYRTGNLNQSGGVVDISDLSILAGDFNKTSWCRLAGHAADLNGDCTINISDLSIFAGEWGL